MPISSQPALYESLVAQIADTFLQGRHEVAVAVNHQLVNTYRQVGRHIVEYEQAGDARAGYGQSGIDTLSRDLSASLGRGFSRSNLIYMRLFYLEWPNGETPSDFLGWFHYVELLKIGDKHDKKKKGLQAESLQSFT